MANGIDQEIQAKVDAYRGNPQALQQRYAQNQQLVDLLALQKLKSEKDAAAREMQMQMQQQPQTIKQQREAELLNMTKQEMVQQTQGILQQRQAEQQKNMQQVAQGGIGALAGQRQAAPQQAPQGQPMPKMARGGIVAFQAGGAAAGDVSPEDIAAFRERIRQSNPRAAATMSDARIAEVLRNMREAPGSTVPDEMAQGYSDLGARMAGYDDSAAAGAAARQAQGAGLGPTTRPRAGGQSEGPMGTELIPEGAMSTMGQGPMSTTAGAQPAQGGLTDLINRQAQPQMSIPEGGIPEVAAETGSPETATAAVEAATTPTAPATGGAGGSGGGGGLPSIGGGGADAAMRRGFQAADEYTGRAEKAGRYADMESELRALDAELYDPEQDRRDQLKAFLAGTANTSNFGSTMAGGTLASLNLRRQQKDERRQRLRDIFDMAERGMTLDSTLAEGGLRLGQQMYADAMANQRTAISAAASMRNADLQAEISRARLQYDQLKDDRDFGLRDRELTIEEARNEATTALTAAENDTRKFAAVSLALDRVQDQEAAVRAQVVEASQIPALQDALIMAQGNEDETARIEEALRTEEALVAIRAEQIFDDMGGVEARDLLAAELLSLTGTGASMISLEDVAGITREE